MGDTVILSYAERVPGYSCRVFWCDQGDDSIRSFIALDADEALRIQRAIESRLGIAATIVYPIGEVKEGRFLSDKASLPAINRPSAG